MEIRRTTVVKLSPEEAREKILAAFRLAFRDPAAARNRAAFVARGLGITTTKLYGQIHALELEGAIGELRERAKERGGAGHVCSKCGKKHSFKFPCPGG